MRGTSTYDILRRTLLSVVMYRFMPDTYNLNHHDENTRLTQMRSILLRKKEKERKRKREGGREGEREKEREKERKKGKERKKKNWLVFIKNFNVIRDQERLKNCFRLKETKET